MHIVISGVEEFREEVLRKFGDTHDYSHADAHLLDQSLLENADLLVDADPGEGVMHYERYLENAKLRILTNSLLTSLNQILPDSLGSQNRIFGFCGWPTFIERGLLEVTALDGQEVYLEELCKSLGTDYRQVSDRIGMATPRVIAMIINEAYYTVQEGTAEKSAIDQAMKLGTNYPFGPFEWSEKIGLKNVYDLLKAIHTDTGEERYKICPLLKKEIHQVQ